MRNLFKISLALFLSACNSCGQPQTSRLSGLGRTKENNKALLFGSPNDLKGVKTDILEVEAFLTKFKQDFNFDVTSVNNATLKNILETTEQYAEEADSLFWYFSGHGEIGSLVAENNEHFTFTEIAEAINRVRSTPLKRLIVLIDACHSGSFVNGASPIITYGPKTYNEIFNEKIWREDIYKSLNENNMLYEQAFVMSASTQDELASDLGAELGGAFTYVWRIETAKLYENNKNATIKDMAEKTRKETLKYTHTPVYKAFPSDEVLNEKLFVYD